MLKSCKSDLKTSFKIHVIPQKNEAQFDLV
jgi:hypothetical protein